MSLEPGLQLPLRHIAGGYALEECDSRIFVVGWTKSPGLLVPRHELEETQKGRSLVPVR